MELKETKHLPTSLEINVVNPSERNNSDNRRAYNLLLSAEEDLADTTNDSKYSDNNHEVQKFGTVSTLDWLKTWRSIEIS